MVEPRWLTSEQLQAWRSFAAVVQLLPGALERPLQRDAELTYFEYMVLAMLSEAPEHTLRMHQLAALTSGSLSRLSHVVARLDRRGWTRRARCEEDGRGTVAVLTDAGYDKVVAAAPVHVASVRDLVIDTLSPEQLQQLGRICTTLLERLDPTRKLTPSGRGARA